MQSSKTPVRNLQFPPSMQLVNLLCALKMYSAIYKIHNIKIWIYKTCIFKSQLHQQLLVAFFTSEFRIFFRIFLVSKSTFYNPMNIGFYYSPVPSPIKGQLSNLLDSEPSDILGNLPQGDLEGTCTQLRRTQTWVGGLVSSKLYTREDSGYLRGVTTHPVVTSIQYDFKDRVFFIHF